MEKKTQQTLKLKDNSKRAKTAISVFWIIIGVCIISLLSNYLQLILLEDANNGDLIDDLSLDMNDVRQMIIAVLYTITYITSVIVFLNWYRRAYGNLHRLKISYLKTSETMAVWYFFIPILSLFKPYQVVNEIWEETQDQIKKRDSQYIRTTNNFIILVWWCLFIVTNIINNYTFKKSLKDETLQDLINSTQDSLLTDFLMIPEALLVILVIKSISKKETELYKLISTEENQLTQQTTISE